MHDIDRTMGRTNMETYEFQGEGEEEFQGEDELQGEGEFQSEEEFLAEGEGEGEGEFLGEGEEEFQAEAGYQGEEEFLGEGEGEFLGEGEEEFQAEAGYQGEEEFLGEGEEEFQGEEELLNEEEVNELATELLSVTNEAELQQFLGGLVRNVGRAVGGFVRSPQGQQLGQQLGGMLRNVARQALPLAGQAIGNYVAPGVGGAVGRQAATAAGQIFGLELEGLSHEDRDFEVAKQFVRLAADAAQTAAQTPPGGAPAAIARQAVAEAAQRYAPGLLERAGGRPGVPSGATSGRWVRRGHRLIVHGI